MKNNLVISEKFYSIQGEGQTMGIPAIFIRLAGCNILCQSESWVCDSIEVWKKGTPTDFKDVLELHEVARLASGAHLVFTGGEPLLHQIKVSAFINWFGSEYKFIPIIEVETNGTIMPSADMLIFVDYWNCSPKLENSGESVSRRIYPKVIKKLSANGNTIFKFVIEKKEDYLGVLNDYLEHLEYSQIVLMPAGDSQEKLQKTRPLVAELCINNNHRYSERLHIVIWNQKTGV